MSIEQDLQQTRPFKNIEQKVLVNLYFTTRYLEAKSQKRYKRFGITMKQYNILRILKGAAKPISTQLIRERMIDRMSDISRIVDRMIDKDLISKCVNRIDKRLVDISIRPLGVEILQKCQMESEKKENNTLSHLTNDELQVLNDLLDKIRGHKVCPSLQ